MIMKKRLSQFSCTQASDAVKIVLAGTEELLSNHQDECACVIECIISNFLKAIGIKRIGIVELD